MRKFKAYSPTILFLVFVFTLTVLFFVTPKKDYSENEKKKLASPPSFSASALIDGSFSEDFETYLAEHFPFRDAFVGIQSYYELATGRNGASDVYFGKDGYLIAAESTVSAEPNDQDAEALITVDEATASVRTNVENFVLFSKYLTDRAEIDRASMLLIPQAGYILDDKLPAVHRPYHDELFFDAVEETRAHLPLIDVREALSQGNADNRDMYFKTDHHLTMDGAFTVYNAYCEQTGLTPYTDYTVETHDGFYGTSYSKGGFWGSAPDTISLFHSELADEVTVRISPKGITAPPEDSSEEESDEAFKIIESASLFFPAHLENMDKYPIYLNGNNGLVTIDNPEAPEGTLLILKDSFAHNITTLLCQHYSKIVMVDLRYYSDSADMTVRELIAEHDVSEMLFLYGIDSLLSDSSSSFKLFYGMEEALG